MHYNIDFVKNRVFQVVPVLIIIAGVSIFYN